jgi:hypothetical protein
MKGGDRQRGFALSVENILNLISMLSVTIVLSFLVLLSIFNGDFKGLWLLFGVLVWYFLLATPIGIQYILSQLMGIDDTDKLNIRSHTCEGVDIGLFENKLFPSTSTSVFGMIMSYLIVPMANMPWRNENMGLIIGMTIILYLIILSRKGKCETLLSLIVGAIVGMVFGFIWYLISKSINNELVYNGYFSNDAVCSVASKTFVCKKREKNP